MSLYEVFSRGAPKKKGDRDNCLIRLTQYPPLMTRVAIELRLHRSSNGSLAPSFSKPRCRFHKEHQDIKSVEFDIAGSLDTTKYPWISKNLTPKSFRIKLFKKIFFVFFFLTPFHNTCFKYRFKSLNVAQINSIFVIDL